jgi:hypothetical protein
MWFRVFGSRDTAPEPADFLKHLHEFGVPVPGHFGGDDQGWFRADFEYEPGTPPLRLNRYLVVEEDLRDELNAWGAWLESLEEHPNTVKLMQKVIGSQQLFTLECPRDRFEEELVRKLCLTVCQYLARETEGVYQVDRQGFFAANGKQLVSE